MIVESPTHPGHLVDIPLPDGPPVLRGPPGTDTTGDQTLVWRRHQPPRLCGTGHAVGLTTGVPVLDDTLGGVRPGASYLLRSPAGEAVEAARTIVAAARSLGVGGRLVDPSTMLRHAVPEGDPGAWDVVRPTTVEALTRIQAGPAEPDAGPLGLLVVAAPEALLHGRDRKGMARFARWAQETLAQAARDGIAVVFVLPWSGPVTGRAFRGIEQTAAHVVRLERLVGGGVSVRDVRDGRVRVVDGAGRTDPARERRARAPVVPWGMRFAV